MNDSSTADARRFRFSLVVSVLLNLGLFALVGRLGQSTDLIQPQGRPHLRMVTLSLKPSPPPSGRRGATSAPRLTAAVVPSQPTETPRPPGVPRPLTRVHVQKTAAAPPPLFRVFRIVTTTRPSARTLPHQAKYQAHPDLPVQAPPAQAASRQALLVPAVPVPVRLPATPMNIAAAPTLDVTMPTPATKAPPTSKAAFVVRAPALSHQEASRGMSSSSAGWTAGIGRETNVKAGGPFGIGDGLAASGVARHIVYVLDTSGSMKSRMDRAEDELRGALRGLRPGETFNIVAFSGGSQVFDPDMAEATPGTLQRASAFLHDLEASGDTDLEDAVVRALMLRDVNEVVILTDGVPTLGEKDPEKLASALRRFNTRHARISTIGLVGRDLNGKDNSFDATQLLQQIARDSGGTSKLATVGVASP